MIPYQTCDTNNISATERFVTNSAGHLGVAQQKLQCHVCINDFHFFPNALTNLQQSSSKFEMTAIVEVH
jgi:hypothetical protein